MSDVMRHHSKNIGADGARFGPGDSITQVTPKGTNYDIVRGVENAGIREKAVLGRGSVNVRGNGIHGISDKNLKKGTGQRRAKLASDFLIEKESKKFSELPSLETRKFSGAKSITC